MLPKPPESLFLRLFALQAVITRTPLIKWFGYDIENSSSICTELFRALFSNTPLPLSQIWKVLWVTNTIRAITSAMTSGSGPSQSTHSIEKAFGRFAWPISYLRLCYIISPWVFFWEPQKGRRFSEIPRYSIGWSSTECAWWFINSSCKYVLSTEYFLAKGTYWANYSYREDFLFTVVVYLSLHSVLSQPFVDIWKYEGLNYSTTLC